MTHRGGSFAVLVLASAFTITIAAAQTPTEKPSFEVASVKPNKSGDNRVMIATQPGGGMTVTNLSLRLLVTWAYELQDFQLVGAPDWADQEHFDIVAKAHVDR